MPEHRIALAWAHKYKLAGLLDEEDMDTATCEQGRVESKAER